MKICNVLEVSDANSYTVLLNRGPHKRLKMLPNGAEGVWNEKPEAVLLDGALIRENIEKVHVHMCWLAADIDKLNRLERALERGLQDLDMPIYNFTGGGHFDDLRVEEGRHRTFMLIECYGVAFLPVLVPASLAPKFRRFFGYRKGYLTQIEHHEVLDLRTICTNGVWCIGTDMERESVETFSSKEEAEKALHSGQWNQRDTI